MKGYIGSVRFFKNLILLLVLVFIAAATIFALRNQAKLTDLEGRTLALHTYSHEYDDIYESVEAYLGDMYRLFTLIKDATGVTPTHFRLPGGSINGYNYKVSQEILTEMLRRGFIPYDWNVSSGDASSGGASADYILSNVISGASGLDRGILLMHDAAGKHTTVAALRPMIQRLRSIGFTFDSLQPDTSPFLFDYAY